MVKFTFAFCIIFLVLANIAYGQTELKISGLGTTYIVSASVGDKLAQGKCPCSIPSRGNCSLYDLKIKKVLYYFENKVFSMEELQGINRLLISSKVKLKGGHDYVMSLQPGTSKSFVQFTDTLSINPLLEYKIIHRDGYLSDLVKCKEKDKFENLILKKRKK